MRYTRPIEQFPRLLHFTPYVSMAAETVTHRILQTEEDILAANKMLQRVDHPLFPDTETGHDTLLKVLSFQSTVNRLIGSVTATENLRQRLFKTTKIALVLVSVTNTWIL